MGIIPKPDDPGNDCVLCWELGTTPTELKLFLSGIRRGDAWQPIYDYPPNGYWDLLQVPEAPCWWGGAHYGFPTIQYRLAFEDSVLTVKASALRFAFKARKFRSCVRSFGNVLQGAAGNAFYGGYAHIYTSSEIAATVEMVTPMFDPDPRMELFPVDDESYVARYAGKRDATNIKIKFDTDLAYWYEHFGQ